MARRTIFLPDELADVLKVLAAQINVSEVCAQALRAEVDRLVALHAELHSALEGTDRK